MDISKKQIEETAIHSTSLSDLLGNLGFTKSGANTKNLNKLIKEYSIETKFNTIVHRIVNNDDIFIQDSTANQSTLRRHYYELTKENYHCYICGQESAWFGKELSLTLDHINGDNHDDRFENLRWICPNCDRQLDTFSGKNIKNRKSKLLDSKTCKSCGKEFIPKNTIQEYCCIECVHISQRKTIRPSKDELSILIRNYTFVDLGKMFDVSDNTIRKWCKIYGLPYLKSEILNT